MPSRGRMLAQLKYARAYDPTTVTALVVLRTYETTVLNTKNNTFLFLTKWAYMTCFIASYRLTTFS
jgi:hypothetical protein